MNDFLKVYGDTEGPFGFPMKDADAKAIEALMKQHPDHKWSRVVVQKATTELADGERADVSWIQTETIDRQKEIVLTSGFRDDTYQGNPIVTINHNYYQPPIGRSAWRKKVRDGDRRGVKAKTIYPSRPPEWNQDIWPSDSAWSLVKAGLMTGKSIGFLSLKAHAPTDEEIKKNSELATVTRIVDEWVLVEYACCWLPMNPQAVVEAVSKSLVTIEELQLVGHKAEPPFDAKLDLDSKVTFTPLSEIEKAIKSGIDKIDWKKKVQDILDAAIERMKGKI